MASGKPCSKVRRAAKAGNPFVAAAFWREPRKGFFWVNNGHDEADSFGGLDKDLPVPPNPQNYLAGEITCPRDLENFTRLWICGLPSLATNYQVTLNWVPYSTSGNPAINLYNSVEADGGTGFLTDTNIAAQQCIAYAHGTSPYNVYFTGPRMAIANITTNSSFVFPASYFTNVGNKYLLFEGAGIGSGELTMTVSRNSNVIAQTGVWLDLHDIKDFYEQAHIGGLATAYPAMVNSTNASFFASDHALPTNSIEAKQLVVFVHGWRLGVWDYQDFSDTMFKRLYWQGYQGRFAALRWPTLSSDDFKLFSKAMGYLTYNPSEYIAFRSAQGTSDYFDWLKSRFPDYSINAVAHSMGNIVMMETLKLQVAEGHKDIDNYMLMQAAVPAHCYDANAPLQPSLAVDETPPQTPNTYLLYPGAITNAINGAMFNFFNTNDYALNFWIGNEDLNKPYGSFGYTVLPVLQPYKLPSTLVTDPREIMAFVSRPRSYAVGMQPDVQGLIQEQGQIDLTARFGFKRESWDHSGEFNRPIQQVSGFYTQLGLSLGVIKIQTP